MQTVTVINVEKGIKMERIASRMFSNRSAVGLVLGITAKTDLFLTGSNSQPSGNLMRAAGYRQNTDADIINIATKVLLGVIMDLIFSGKSTHRYLSTLMYVVIKAEIRVSKVCGYVAVGRNTAVLNDTSRVAGKR